MKTPLVDRMEESTWKEFPSLVGGLSTVRDLSSFPLWFRGHADTAWKIQATLDRYIHEEGLPPAMRPAIAADLLREFRNTLYGLDDTRLPLEAADNRALEHRARHHGLPTTLLDWSTSPFVSAFFAFEGWNARRSKHVCIYVLDRTKIPEPEVSRIGGDHFAPPDLEFVSDPRELRFNRRALEQQGVFMRVNRGDKPVEELLGDALTGIRMPGADAPRALRELASMNITPYHLFRDVDGAAAAAKLSVRLRRNPAATVSP